jgi:hypothetical protein
MIDPLSLFFSAPPLGDFANSTQETLLAMWKHSLLTKVVDHIISSINQHFVNG